MQEQQKVAKKRLELKSDQHRLDYQIISATVTFVNKVKHIYISQNMKG